MDLRLTLCVAQKKNNCFLAGDTGDDKGEEARLRIRRAGECLPQPGLLFGLLFSLFAGLFLDLCCAPRQKGQPPNGHCDSVARAEPAFYAKCSCVDPRLHRRTESQSYDRPDKIVYRINYLQNVASAPFRYADTHLPKFWPLSSYNLATRTFSTLTLMCFRKLEVLRMLIQLFF